MNNKPHDHILSAAGLLNAGGLRLAGGLHIRSSALHSTEARSMKRVVSGTRLEISDFSGHRLVIDSQQRLQGGSDLSCMLHGQDGKVIFSDNMHGTATESVLAEMQKAGRMGTRSIEELVQRTSHKEMIAAIAGKPAEAAPAAEAAEPKTLQELCAALGVEADPARQKQFSDLNGSKQMTVYRIDQRGEHPTMRIAVARKLDGKYSEQASDLIDVMETPDGLKAVASVDLGSAKRHVIEHDKPLALIEAVRENGVSLRDTLKGQGHDVKPAVAPKPAAKALARAPGF